MRTSTLADAPSGRQQPVRVRRHHRSSIVVVTSVLTLLAVAGGAAVALLDRPSLRPAAVAPAARPGGPLEVPAATMPPAMPATTAARTPVTAPAATVAQPAGQGGAAGPSAVLADGSYPVFIRKVDPAGRTMVVDVIQVFEGRAAFQAALADGLGREAAEVSDPYIRNQNPLLRTLPVARDATIKFLGTCEGPAMAPAVLKELAKRATTSEYSFYTLTVAGGSVHRIVEHQSRPAC
jgi:hypothetical protein